MVWGSNTAAMHATLLMPPAGQACVLEWGCKPPPPPAPSSSHRSSQTHHLHDFSREALPPAAPTLGSPPAPHNHPCPHPVPFHPQEPCSLPRPCKLSSCLTSSEPRSHHNKQHLSPPSCSSVCPHPSASSCPTSDWQCPASGVCPFHITPSHLRRTEIRLNGLYKALEITQRPGPHWKRRKTLQKSQFGQTQCFTTRC